MVFIVLGTRKFGRAWVSIKGVKATGAVVDEISARGLSQKRVQAVTVAVSPIEAASAAVLPAATAAAVATAAVAAVIAAAAVDIAAVVLAVEIAAARNVS